MAERRPESPAASERDLVVVREVVIRTVLEERDGDFHEIRRRVMFEREWPEPRSTAMRGAEDDAS